MTVQTKKSGLQFLDQFTYMFKKKSDESSKYTVK